MKLFTNSHIQIGEARNPTHSNLQPVAVYVIILKEINTQVITIPNWNFLSKEERREYQREHLARKRKLVRQAKDKPCADCGVFYPYYVMDFDHINGDKVDNVSQLNKFTLEKLRAEIAKCEVVCSNCHRERTWG